MRALELMTRSPVTVSRGTSLDRAMDLMDERQVRHLPVVEAGALLGVVSDRELLEATGWLHPREREVLEASVTRVGDLELEHLEGIGPEDELERVLERFVKTRAGALPVVEGEHLVGIVSEADVLRAYADAARAGRIPGAEDDFVQRHMSRDLVTVGPDASGDELLAEMREEKVRHVLVVDDGELVGIVSDRDVRAAIGRGQLETLLVSELMAAEPQTVGPRTSLASVAALLTAERISALPVVERGRVVGLVSTLDVLIPCAIALQAVR